MHSQQTQNTCHRCIRAVLFDFDGTLTVPGAIDFVGMKQAVGCPEDQPVLEYIDTIQDNPAKQQALAALEQIEMAGAENSEPAYFAEEIIAFIQSRYLGVGIISRNGRVSIEKALERFSRTGPDDFHVLVTRDDPVKPKPSSEGILFAAEILDVQPCEMLVVGDYIFDIQAGRSAGALTAFINHPGRKTTFTADSDFTIKCLSELKEILERLGQGNCVQKKRPCHSAKP